MDALLKELADASMAVGAAEEALAEGANVAARDRLDDAAAILAALRERWPELSAAERAVVGKTAAPLRRALEAGRARLPGLSALRGGAPEPDPEDERSPSPEERAAMDSFVSITAQSGMRAWSSCGGWSVTGPQLRWTRASAAWAL